MSFFQRLGLSIILLLATSLGLMQTSAQSTVSFGDFLSIYFDHMGTDIPSSYKYINLNFNGISPDTELYDDLQKAVYLDMVQNKSITFDPTMPMTQGGVATFFRAHFGQHIAHENGKLVDTTYLAQAIQQLPGYKQYYCGEAQRPQAIDLHEFAITQPEEFVVLNDVYVRLTTEYLGEQLLSRDLIFGAAQGMTDVVQDPYTSFFPPVESDSFQEMYNGSYEGIGAILEKTDEGMTIVSPFEGSPAEKAGVKAGDIITHIDGVSVAGWGEGDVIDAIKGPSGTVVVLKLLRNGQPISKSITRKVIKIEFVDHEKINDEVYYIDLDSFGAGSSGAFGSALDAFLSSNTNKLIIDLRNNPGGGIDEVHSMLSHFIPQGQPNLHIKTTTKSFSYKSTGSDKDLSGKEVVVLINKGSASASEIMALTLQDYGLATIVGEKSFGKGSVQTVLEYQKGGALKFTTHKRFSGKTQQSIHEVGVEPDTIVVQDDIKLQQGVDVQLQEALK